MNGRGNTEIISTMLFVFDKIQRYFVVLRLKTLLISYLPFRYQWKFYIGFQDHRVIDVFEMIYSDITSRLDYINRDPFIYVEMCRILLSAQSCFGIP